MGKGIQSIIGEYERTLVMTDAAVDKLREHSSATPSHWREEAEFRIANKSWLRYSQRIAMLLLDRMDELKMTQQKLAETLGCSQQYISKILTGKENLSLETISKLELAMDIKILQL